MTAMERAEGTFDGSRLRLARTLVGKTQAELSRSLDVSHQYIAALENGRKQPTDVLLNAIAELTGFEPWFFVGNQRLEEFRDEECHFRRRQTTPVAARNQVLAHGTLFGELLRYFEEHLELPETNFPEAEVHDGADVERAAEKCRMTWGLGLDTPIDSMTRVLESAGAVVVKLEASPKVDAFSRPGDHPVVVLNTCKGSSSRARFDMAHECGHLVMHGGMETGDRETEMQADAFASALLLPRAGFVREFPRSGYIDWAALLRLKARWKVSLAAIIRRAYDLQLLSAVQYQRAYKQLSARGWRTGEPGEFEHEDPEIVCEAISTLFPDDATPLAHSLGWTFELLEQVVGGPLPACSSPEPAGKVIPITRWRRGR